jgi:hypothetical protein
MSDDEKYMTRAECADIRHRFERERNDVLDKKLESAETRLRTEIEGACETMNAKTLDLKEWIVATETLEKERWDKFDDRMYGLYFWLAMLTLGIFLSIIFKVDIAGLVA